MATTDEILNKLNEFLDKLNGNGFSGGGSRGSSTSSLNGLSRDEIESFFQQQRQRSAKDYEYENKRNEQYERQRRKNSEERIEELKLRVGEDETALEEILDKIGDIQEALEDVSLTEEERITLNEKLNEHKSQALSLQENILNAEREEYKLRKDLSKSSPFTSTVRDAKTFISQLSNIHSDIVKLTDPWSKVDAAASKYAKSVGLAKKGMDSLRDTTLRNATFNNLSYKYNISSEELLEAQTNYIKGAGRNIRVSNSDQENIAAMRLVTGEKGGDIASKLDIFGVTLESSAERVGRMFSDASKQGISFEKYSDNVAQNIKIAQNYTFQNGLKGLESMAKKATALKIDMQQIAAFADKVGTVEDSLQVSAKLQVLGGPFAQMSDPLGMLSDSLNDLEGLEDRITKMVGTLGTFNKHTGEVEMSSFNKRRVRMAAEATGISYETLMDSAFAQARRGEIEKQIKTSKNASSFSDDMRELIMNSGIIRDGKAGVSINGKFKSLDELSNKDYENIKAETNTESENIKDIAKNVRSLVDIRSGRQKQTETWKAWIFGGFGKLVKGVLGIAAIGGSLAFIAAAVSSILGILSIQSGIKGLFGGARQLFSAKAGGAGNSIGKKILSKFGVGSSASTVKGVVPNVITRESANTVAQTTSGLAKNTSQKALVEAFKKNGTGTIAKSIGKKSVMQTGAHLAKSGAAIGGATALNLVSGGLGIVGLAGNILTDSLVNKGKIEKGGTAHTALKTTSQAATFGSIGMMIGSMIAPGIGTAIGGAIGAIGGAVVGLVQTGKDKQEKLLDERAKQLGITVKGKYGYGKLKDINKSLETGNISRSMRRRLERNGDFELVSQIEKVKKDKEQQKQEKRKERQEKRLEKRKLSLLEKESGGINRKYRSATFMIDNANFEGVGFNRLFGRRNVISRGLGGFSEIKNKINGVKDTINVIKETGSLKGALKEIKERRETSVTNIQEPSQEKKSFDININGTLKLVGENGQSVDIIDTLRKNPQVLRELTDMIEKEIRYMSKGVNRPN